MTLATQGTESWECQIRLLPSLDILIQGLLTALIPGKKAKLFFAKASGKDLVQLKDFIEAGKVRAVIDRTYPLSEVAKAHTYSEEEHAVGKIILVIS